MKQAQESFLSNFYESAKLKKESLREELKQARESEHKFPSSNIDFDRVYKKHIVIIIKGLKNLRLKIYNNIKKERAQHFDLREKKLKKKNLLLKLAQELKNRN